MRSAYTNPQVVDDYLAVERAQGRLIGPILRSSLASTFYSSPFGVIPKRNCPGKWRLLTFLHLRHGSVNEGIDPTLSSLCYSGLDDVVLIIILIV